MRVSPETNPMWNSQRSRLAFSMGLPADSHCNGRASLPVCHGSPKVKSAHCPAAQPQRSAAPTFSRLPLASALCREGEETEDERWCGHHLSFQIPQNSKCLRCQPACGRTLRLLSARTPLLRFLTSSPLQCPAAPGTQMPSVLGHPATLIESIRADPRGSASTAKPPRGQFSL